MNKESEAGSRKKGSSIQQQYDDIAFIYDLLSDGDDVILYFRMHAEKEIAKLSQSAKILDCSCGTGNHAIWMARQGFDISASDISEEMVALASAKAGKENVSINFFKSSWEELPAMTRDTFDLVVSPGNSMAHLYEMDSLLSTFKAIKEVLNPGAAYFFDVRNWEKTFEEASLISQDFDVKNEKGNINVRYSYDIRGWNAPCIMHVDIQREGEEESSRYPFHFLPIAYQQFHDALSKAGFIKINRGFYPGEDYYFVVAK